MIPVVQTITTPPRGNCVQAALASVLELPLDHVPNFAEVGVLWWPHLKHWLREACGLGLVVMDPEEYTPPGFHLISAPSLRGPYRHALVGFRGEMVHDPYPGGPGPGGPFEEFWVLFDDTTGRICKDPAGHGAR